MDNNLRFADHQAFVDIPPALRELEENAILSPEISDWANAVALLVDSLSSGIVFKIGKLRLDFAHSQRIAKRIAHLVCTALKSHGVPKSAFVEIDRIRPVKVWNHQVRTLLPHTDGAHCSYLTPSLVDYPCWDIHLRTFSQKNFSTTGRHKLYQGNFIVDPGDGLSVTTYYDWLKILNQAYSLASHKKEFSIEELQYWLGENIKRALKNQPLHRNHYLSIGAALGSSNLLYQGIVCHAAEEALTSQEQELFPELRDLNQPGSRISSDIPIRTRILSMAFSEVLNMTWEDFRAAYEICLPSERFDYVLGHNLILLHGGLMGGPTRRLEPMCIVLDRAEGYDYEKWLSQAWKRMGTRFFTSSL